MKKLSLIAVLLCVGFAWHYAGADKNETTTLRTATVKTGNLEDLVSSTGTLSAVGTVEVGTQVSGTVAEILADFNDRVSAGQRLAVIDTAILATAVRDAEANLARSRAQYEQAVADYDRNRTLFERGFISEREFESLKTVVTTSHASVASAEAALERARTNLDYAWIRAPIAGTVIQRNIEAGQTVQASFSAPTLFVIAEDLERMEILAQVDESDIGRIQGRQEVRFTVQSYPKDEFVGTVRQIRLQPKTVQNVVTYTVVIDATNPERRLLPGMTATVDFVVGRAADALLVPNNALAFRPTAEFAAKYSEQRPDRSLSDANATEKSPRDWATPERARGVDASDGTTQRPKDMAVVWYLDDANAPVHTRVRMGVSDGLETALVEGGDLAAGSQVITGFSAQTQTASKASSPNNSRSRGRPGLF